jgi:hypothetical protein
LAFFAERAEPDAIQGVASRQGSSSLDSQRKREILKAEAEATLAMALVARGFYVIQPRRPRPAPPCPVDPDPAPTVPVER